MAQVSDEQQMKGNLGGPDLFLAPIGRLDSTKITKHFCNTCEKEFEGSPKIEFENPNEEVAENLVLAERGQYICNSCSSVIAEYRQFKKPDEAVEVGNAKPLEPQTQSTTNISEPETIIPTTIPQTEQTTKPSSSTAISSIEGRLVFDENANKVGTAKQVGIDETQSMVLVITQNDGTEGTIPWKNIRKVGEVILLGNPESTPIATPGKCSRYESSGLGDTQSCLF